MSGNPGANPGTPPRPAVGGVLETALYVDDLDRASDFYCEILGMEVMRPGRNIRPLSVAGRHVLLLCKKGGSTRPRRLSGGVVPPHDGDGRLHLAFSIPTSDFEAWRTWLEHRDVPIESVVEWELGGRSLYFRDPDGHAVELATPGTWPIY
ncbi:MAG: VOC family protein [Acidobacteriota bacterium]|jgi:catechol 2,3-dioxygenase-like lactoylglutathione lyase family enzyme